MKKLISPLLFAAFLVCSNQSFSQSQTFMKVSGSGYKFIGDATAAGYENQIEVFSYSDGIAGCTTSTLGGSGACTPSFTGFSTLISLSPAVNDFRAVMLTGATIKSIDVVQVKPSADKSLAYYKIHLENVQVTSVQEGASSEKPTISLTLVPQKIAWQINTQKADGSLQSFSFGWDFVRNNTYGYKF
jgi:type VI protein secretion system component Hcp